MGHHCHYHNPRPYYKGRSSSKAPWFFVFWGTFLSPLLLLLSSSCGVGNNGTAAAAETVLQNDKVQKLQQQQYNAAEVVAISYSDLVSYFEHKKDEHEKNDDDTQTQLQQQQQQQQQHLLNLGFLQVTDIPPEMVALRRRVLDMAHSLAHLDASTLQTLERPDSHHTIGWSRGVEEFKPGVPDDGKGSFYYDPFVGMDDIDDADDDDDDQKNQNHNVFPKEEDLPELEAAMREMTHFMAKVGLWIVRLMDEHLQTDIYKSLESCEMAKARLLYYYPPTRASSTASSPASTNVCEGTNNSSSDRDEEDQNQQRSNDAMEDDDSNWWCGWHKDHGSLTALLPGQLIGDDIDKNNDDDDDDDDDTVEAASTTSASSTTTTTTTTLPPPPPGLYIDTLERGRTHVSLPPTSLGFQLGETIQLLSRGRLRATPHAVRAPTSRTSTSTTSTKSDEATMRMGRASLALFLQPPADQALPPIDEEDVGADESLRARWRPTFGEFQRATTQAFQ
eukprot:CAMPEP_0117018604 /NCGR_PEP_ID=MMETSP0472-20121206/14368_1 /TAXON_ID=693140 ORGANISM="Tiarina fusus, Strain LIS" /NCGR_SAMPLE_ID=MMETSP0472 /ASSEMBLY_ACC=CAM_ASM_000603 /LENGTH=504 /DNA_ID=CAMNT_0004723307 /DNA_START=298 /DNA_END=1812 /DNA_ORIENTATION=+